MNHMMSRILSEAVYVGSEIELEEIQRTWLEDSRWKVVSCPVPGIKPESVKLTKLDSTVGLEPVAQANPRLLTSSSEWSTISKHEPPLPEIMLVDR